MRTVTRGQLWIDALGAGAIAGLVAEALVLRMNPEASQAASGVLVGMPLWASWGMLLAGVPLALALVAAGRLLDLERRWLAPELAALVFLVAALLALVNARLHVHLLRGSAQRVLIQDAAAWMVALVLALAGGALVRRLGAAPALRAAFSLVLLALPALRVVGAPTPERRLEEVAARPLGTPSRPLLVIGLEGLDAKFLLTDSIGSSSPVLARLREAGGRVRLKPHRPYLRWALWTSAATGTYPGRHGVKAHWGWDLPLVFGETLRLLPWTPEGSRMILPWGLAERVPPPPATVAPLWARLAASGVPTGAFGWPGSWGADPSLRPEPELERAAGLEPSMGASLEAALAPFPERQAEIWAAILRDQARIDAAREALAAGTTDLWLHLETLALARRYYEPLHRRQTAERQLLELVSELVDQQLGDLVAAAPPTTLIAVVSPYGLAPPGAFERFKRLLGVGEDWHTSAESCPEGLLVLLGDAVEVGPQPVAAAVPDLAPTLCYLLGLPVAQYMEGGVVIDLVKPSYLATHPLRVVE
jgi:hypothetical protein